MKGFFSLAFLEFERFELTLFLHQNSWNMENFLQVIFALLGFLHCEKVSISRKKFFKKFFFFQKHICLEKNIVFSKMTLKGEKWKKRCE